MSSELSRTSQPFVNWARNVRSQPQEWHTITEEDQLAQVVTQAHQRGQAVKALGSRHSWSPIAAPDSVALEMHGYNRLLDMDREEGLVTVQSGMRLRDLNNLLDNEGLGLSILGSVTAQTIAGATATGTHGSSLVHGSLSSFLKRATIVNGKGELVELSGEELEGGKVHLGALGLLSTVSLQVEPAFRLEESTEARSWEQVLADLPEIARSAEYVKLWWLPHTNQVQIFRYHRTDKPATFSHTARWVDEAIVNRHVFSWILWLGKHRPDWIPAINRWLEPQYFKPLQRVGRSFDVLTLAMPPIHQETEYSVPLERAASALGEIRELVERDNLHVNFILEMRFVPPETSWMSPAFGRASCNIGLYMAESRDMKAYFTRGQEILWRHEGRPHWGKEFQQDMKEVTARYPKFAAFSELAAKHDPDGLFHNGFLRQLFEGERTPANTSE